MFSDVRDTPELVTASVVLAPCPPKVVVIVTDPAAMPVARPGFV
jgi:hypothetical protein